MKRKTKEYTKRRRPTIGSDVRVLLKVAKDYQNSFHSCQGNPLSRDAEEAIARLTEEFK